MPRRPPPSSLRLVQGPTPPRDQPKHTLPSVPRPTFHPPAFVVLGPAPRRRHSAPRQTTDNNSSLLAQVQSGDIPVYLISSGDISPTTSISLSRPPSQPGSRSSSPKMLRGPWDHSGCISLPFDVETVLAPLKPVATIAGSGW